jgi:hypothetical protein
MKSLILLGIVVGVGYWIYMAGQRDGSRKGYQVGLRRGRSRRKNPPPIRL